MSGHLTMTSLRLPRHLLKDLKTRAMEEGLSLNRLILDLLESSLRKPVPRGVPKDDPLWLIGSDPGCSDITDASERLDDYLYGPVTYKPPPKT